MKTESDTILIHFSSEKYLLWNVQDIRSLRSKYRIIGTFVGCLPRQSYQNSQLGVPLQLMREEVAVLLENNSCKLVTLNEHWLETEDTEISLQYDDCKNKSFEEYRNLLKEERIEQLKRKCAEIAAGKQKRLKELTDSAVNVDNFVDEEINRLPDVSVDLFPIQLFTRIPLYLNSSEAHERYFKDITSQFNYPESSDEILKYAIFKDLWRKGYFITNGFKFGCDYLVYEGDPCICHAKYMIVCLQLLEKELSPLKVHILGRLSVQVNKKVLIASIETDNNVIYKSLNCDALRNPFK